jgi:hypothetical protein
MCPYRRHALARVFTGKVDDGLRVANGRGEIEDARDTGFTRSG